MELLTEMSTLEKDPRVASRSTLEQQDALESKFMELSCEEGSEHFRRK